MPIDAEPPHRAFVSPAPCAEARIYPLCYNPALDGLRAVAVVAVMFFHFNVPGFLGGAVGVDIFFVLSGYLITSLLVLGIRQRQPLGVFYWQRFLRLAPPLVLLCATLLAIGRFLGISSQTVADSLASLLYVSNWTAAFHAGGVAMYLGNTWSLATEEQFYLVWPLLLVGMRRTGGGHFALATSIGLLAVSLFWQQWMIVGGADYERIYYGFDTRGFGLMTGCVIALSSDHLVRLPCRFLRPASVAGATFLIGIVMSVAWTPLISLGASVAAGAVIADLATYRSGPIYHALSLRGPVAIGRISYSVYLWHYPIMLTINRHFAIPGAVGALLGISLSILCATASFFAVETPARRVRNALSLRYTAVAGGSVGLASLIGMFVGAGIFWLADITNLIDPKPLEIVGYGPLNLRRGDTFNVQPDGNSVMWIKTSRSVPVNARIKVGSDILETSARSTLTTAILPSSITDRVGPVAISIVGASGNLLAGPVSLVVSP